jgi:hypothetical protein
MVELVFLSHRRTHMSKSYWTVPVDIRLAGIPRIRTITTSGFAFECLTTMWPVGSHGPSFYSAILACFDAIDGRSSHLVARHAFIKAARDADICD